MLCCSTSTCSRQLLFVIVVAVVIFSSLPSVGNSQLCYRNAVSMRFKPRSAGPPYSFFFQSGQSGVQMSRSRPFPPVIIQILDSNGDVDYTDSASDVTITASSTTRLASAGATIPVVYGEAQFVGLLVEGTDALYNLTFTATSSSPLLAVANGNASTLNVFNVTNIQIPINIFALVFAQNSSMVLYAGQSISVVLGRVVPTILLNVVNSQYLTFPTSTVLGSNYSVVVSTSDPRISVVSGGVVPVLDGEALFDALVLAQSTPSSSSIASMDYLLFTLLDAGTPTKYVRTGTVNMSTVVQDYTDIAFERQDTSLISSVGQSVFVTAGAILPQPIRISLRNNIGLRSPDASGLVITATCSVPYALRGYQVGVINGVATFANISFDSRVSGRVTLVFTAGSQGSLPLAGKTISTGWLMVSPRTSPAASLSFLANPVDSFFNYPRQKADVVLFANIPTIVVQLLDSANNIDTKTSSIIIVASATSGVNFPVVQKPVQAGQAVFSALQFTSTAATIFPRITFTATNNASLTVNGQQLVTGIVNVAATQANYNLRFQPYGVGLFPAAGLDSVATINVPLPKIIVELTTSAGDQDPTSSEISITASAAGATVSGSFMRVSSGVAVFDSLMFVSETPGQFVLTFTAGSEVDAPVAGKTIFTGTIRVASGVTPAFGIRFAKESYIAYSGHVVPVTSGTVRNGGLTAGSYRIPPVILELIDSVHNVSTSLNVIVLQCVFSTGTVDGNPNGRQIRMPPGQSRATFSNLAIQSATSPSLTFTVSGTPDPVNGMKLFSGALRFFSKPSYGYLNITSASLAPGARLPATINSGATMVFVIQLMDTAGFPMNTLSGGGLSVSASCFSALKGASGIKVDPVTGIGTFSALQFAQRVPSSPTPIITFTASFDSGATTAIDPVTTGIITVVGPSAESGIDVVAQVLFDFSGFDSTAWIATLARILNVETSRFLVSRAYYGTGADVATTSTVATVSAPPSTDTSATSAVNKTANLVAVWYGTRIDLRILEPLATSRNTKPAWAVVNAFLNIKNDCASAPTLYLRKTMNRSRDNTCDWYMFEDQMTSAQQCVLSAGEAKFCDCYVNIVQTMGLKCLGYSTLSDLCLKTLLTNAQCTDPRIVSVCTLLQTPPVSRVTLLASGVFFGFILAFLAALKSNGFFHKLQRPEAHASFPKPERLNLDESDLL